jgi:hypothetical protein
MKEEEVQGEETPLARQEYRMGVGDSRYMFRNPELHFCATTWQEAE